MKALVSRGSESERERKVFKTKLMAFLKNTKLIFGCRNKTPKKKEKSFRLKQICFGRIISSQAEENLKFQHSTAFRKRKERESFSEHKQKFLFICCRFICSHWFVIPFHSAYVESGQIWLRDYVPCVQAKSKQKRSWEARTQNVLNKYLNDKLKLIYNYPSCCEENPKSLWNKSTQQFAIFTTTPPNRSHIFPLLYSWVVLWNLLRDVKKIPVDKASWESGRVYSLRWFMSMKEKKSFSSSKAFLMNLSEKVQTALVALNFSI